jgi:hypothetical protein
LRRCDFPVNRRPEPVDSDEHASIAVGKEIKGRRGTDGSRT